MARTLQSKTDLHDQKRSRKRQLDGTHSQFSHDFGWHSFPLQLGWKISTFGFNTDKRISFFENIFHKECSFQNSPKMD